MGNPARTRRKTRRNARREGNSRPANPSIEQAILQSDGKIVIAQGINASYGGNPGRYVIRVNSDGSFDSTFNTGGSGADSAVGGLGIQSDGKILIGGDFTVYNGTARTSIARLNTDGTLDTLFVPPTLSSGFVEYFAIQTDGKVLAAGVLGISGTNYSVIRMNSNGSLDSSLLNSANSFGYHVGLQADGKILVVGGFTRFATGGTRGGMARFNTNGTIDTGFTPSFTRFGIVNAIAQQADGKVIVGGQFQRANGNFSNNVARFNADQTYLIHLSGRRPRISRA